MTFTSTHVDSSAGRERLTFPAAISDRANWYQRWNSSKANFMALSKHWLERKTNVHIPRTAASRPGRTRIRNG